MASPFGLNLNNVCLVLFHLFLLTCLSVSGSQEETQSAESEPCSSFTTCATCIENSCLYYYCDTGDHKCGEKNQTLLCEDSESETHIVNKCDEPDNPVDELGDDSKMVDKKQEPKYHATQQFDLASFCGGIALSVCLAGLAFILYKFWQSRQQNIAYSTVDGKNQY